MTSRPNYRHICEGLLASIGSCEAIQKIKPVSAGRNNKVFRIFTSNRNLIAKFFYNCVTDHRDRFISELTFYQYIMINDISGAPNLLAKNKEQRVILLEDVSGKALKSGTIGKNQITQAMDFIVALNRGSKERQSIGPASEACLFIRDYEKAIDRRLNRLKASNPEATICQFIETELGPVWDRIRQSTFSRRRISNVNNINEEDRLISPSDFGFHNCIETRGGRLIFYDFEYAGWDDPAKLIGDFFCQVEVPVPIGLFKDTIEKLSGQFCDFEGLKRRVLHLLPAIQLKWCCLLLNEFLTTDADRREFSGNTINDTIRQEQLEKARVALNRADELNKEGIT